MTLTTVEGGGGVPVEPDWSKTYADPLDVDVARSQWGIVTREMRDAQTIAVVNGHMIERMVRFRVEYERAARIVGEQGSITKAPKTGVPMTNPYWSVMRQADEAIRALEVELGIPPVRRGKAAKVNRVKKAARPSDSYLKKAN